MAARSLRVHASNVGAAALVSGTTSGDGCGVAGAGAMITAGGIADGSGGGYVSDDKLMVLPFESRTSTSYPRRCMHSEYGRA